MIYRGNNYICIITGTIMALITNQTCRSYGTLVLFDVQMYGAVEKSILPAK